MLDSDQEPTDDSTPLLYVLLVMQTYCLYITYMYIDGGANFHIIELLRNMYHSLKLKNLKAIKKIVFLMAGPVRPYPPPIFRA